MANGYFGEILRNRIEEYGSYTLVRGLTCEFLITKGLPADHPSKMLVWPRGMYNSRITGIGTATRPTYGALKFASRIEAKAFKHLSNLSNLEVASNLRYGPIWEFRPVKSFWYNWLGFALMVALGYYIGEIAIIVVLAASTIMWNFSLWLLAATWMADRKAKR